MTIDDRKTLAKQPITWTGDLSDDCTAKWAGLMLRAEWMDEDYWWWAVYDMQKEEATIDDSNNYTDRFIGGDISRQKAENVAKKYITEITARQETAKYLIADTFKITGRGLVFAGYITEGLVSIGDTIEFVALSTIFKRRIIGIEGITKSQPDKNNTGLLIKCDSEAEIDELRNWKPDNVVATVYKTEMSEKNLAATNSTLPKAGRTWLQKLFGYE
ncbi:MAG: hypothetical protein CMP76_13990 [Flavobacterium sp.]|uniref:hypothetical protein n=1 Tax=Flavobacterium sp. TaxID=239 RepID=UPI000C5B70E3|nr:hypothetical protein [Flavobacterium sp.]MBF02496.1 hypothetical protein [Flavobacterium sp.]MBF04393.1 hypothetical protein [Flavobacterium sp.]|tara:strand:+ start:1281 stop:1928 length:648 start_codon:yes stop_codon:yes gene_type:complete